MVALQFVVILSAVFSLLSPAAHAGNIYPVRVSDDHGNTGDVDTVRFSGGTLSIATISGGGRMGTLTISASGGGSGGGGGTNFQTSLGIVFTGNAGSLSIGINPSLVLTAGAPVSAIAGALSASSTNNLADKSLVNSTSNTIMQAFDAASSNAVSLTLIPSNGVLFIDLGGGSNALAIDPAVVVTSGAPFSLLSGALPFNALPSSVGTNFTASSGTWSNDAANYTWIYTPPAAGGGVTNMWAFNGAVVATNDTFGFSNTSGVVSMNFSNINGVPTIYIAPSAQIALLNANQDWTGPQTFDNTGTAHFNAGTWQLGKLVVSNDVLVTGNGTINGNLTVNGSLNVAVSSLTGQITMTQLPTNGISTSTSLGAVFSNGVLVTASTVVPLTNATSTAPGLIAVSTSGGTLAVAPNMQILTNSGTQPLVWNGTATISNNATVTGTFTVNGALNASNIVGAVTSAVATVNGLVSNITLTATGNATISTTSSSSGGTITINDPRTFVATNPPSSGVSASLIWDTKYGAMRVSNNFGFTFIDTPQLSGMSNVVDSMSSWFANTATDAWTQVNMTNSWSIVNTNDHLLLQSGGAAVGAGQYLVNQITSSNTSWSYSILVDGIEDGGTIIFNAGIGIVSMEGTNSNCHNFAIVRGSGSSPELRGFLSSSPASSFQVADTGGADPGSSIGAIYGAATMFHTDLPSPIWLRVAYDGSTNLTYQYAFVRQGQPAVFHTISTRTNQTALISYVGLGFFDQEQTKPSYLIKACVFESPWTNGQP